MAKLHLECLSLNTLNNQFMKDIKGRLNYQKKLTHHAGHKGHATKTLLYKEIVSTTEPDRLHKLLKEEVRIYMSPLKKMTVLALIHIAYGYKLSLKMYHGEKKKL